MVEALLILIGFAGIVLGAVVYAFFVAAETDDDDHDDWRHA